MNNHDKTIECRICGGSHHWFSHPNLTEAQAVECAAEDNREFEEMVANATYRRVVIEAPGQEIWLADDEGNLVVMEKERLDVSVMTGKYLYRLGLMGEDRPLNLDQDAYISHGQNGCKVFGNAPPGYLRVIEDLYFCLPDNRKKDRGRENLYCPEGYYWTIRCNICGGIEQGESGNSVGIDWHSECQAGMVQPQGREPFKALLVNVKRWWARNGYLWLEDDTEDYL